MKNIVSQQWLKNNLSLDHLVLLEARETFDATDSSANQHIPKAQYVLLEEHMSGELQPHGGRHPLPDMEKFVRDMEAFGINDESIVVIYDSGSMAPAGRLWWLFKYIGKDQVFVLEGGLTKWVENGFTVTTEQFVPKPSGHLSLSINDAMLVDMQYVKDTIGSKNIALVDARASERYAGEVEPIDRVAGHIPGAINYPWMNLTANQEIMEREALEKYFEPLKEFEEIIVYCGSGVTAVVDILFMEEVGLNPKLYAGSYSDWISYEDNEIITK